MNKEDFESLKRGLVQVAEYRAGARDGYTTHEPVDVKAVRSATGLTQPKFADVYHIPVGTLRDWEQGRRVPDAPARSFLTLIAKDPKLVERMLSA